MNLSAYHQYELGEIWRGFEAVPPSGVVEIEFLLAQVMEGGHDHVAVESGGEDSRDEMSSSTPRSSPSCAEAAEHDRSGGTAPDGKLGERGTVRAEPPIHSYGPRAVGRDVA